MSGYHSRPHLTPHDPCHKRSCDHGSKIQFGSALSLFSEKRKQNFSWFCGWWEVRVKVKNKACRVRQVVARTPNSPWKLKQQKFWWIQVKLASRRNKTLVVSTPDSAAYLQIWSRAWPCCHFDPEVITSCCSCATDRIHLHWLSDRQTNRQIDRQISA